MVSKKIVIKNKVTKQIYYDILRYYIKLYNNYEMKTVCEIADDLNISVEIVNKFINKVYKGINAYGELSEIDKIILLSTKFEKNSEHSEYIKEKKIINKMHIMREVKKMMRK